MNRLISNILATDGYKPSHYLQDPPLTLDKFSYIEARKGPPVTWFGLQSIIQEYLMNKITMKDVAEAKAFFASYGTPFNEDGWKRIVTNHGGYMPVRICAAEEGLRIPTGNVLATVETIDSELPWVGSYLETLLLRVWYPTTVATRSSIIKDVIKAALKRSGDVDNLPWKLHDFGARGASSGESAAIGGMAHLVNFVGSDTLEGVYAAMTHYGAPGQTAREFLLGGGTTPAVSIPASEHSTITAWGRDHEADAYANMIDKFGGEGKVFACVIDSYDDANAVDRIWGQELKQKLLDSKATFVARPDSGNPVLNVIKIVRILDARFGSVVNAKGYRVLNNVRVIQGDGIDNEGTVSAILEALMGAGYSADNVAFGMGGGLLQKLDRDTYSFAMKVSAAFVADEWRDVFKSPSGDSGKRSKAGLLTLMRNHTTGEFKTVTENEGANMTGWTLALKKVYEDGEQFNITQLAEVRANTQSW
jgi:nicotinamide phosphoribosyltransferase